MSQASKRAATAAQPLNSWGRLFFLALAGSTLVASGVSFFQLSGEINHRTAVADQICREVEQKIQTGSARSVIETAKSIVSSYQLTSALDFKFVESGNPIYSPKRDFD